MLIMSVEMMRDPETCQLCFGLEPVELLRQTAGWERSDLHVHVTGAKIQVCDNGGLVKVVTTER